MNQGASGTAPAWLDNLAALGWRVLVVAALGVALWIVAGVLWTVTASIAVAVAVTAAFLPLMARLRASGRSANASAMMAWGTALGLLGGFLLVAAIVLLPAIADVLRAVERGADAVTTEMAALALPAWVGDLVVAAVRLVRESGGEAAGAIVAAAAGAVTVAILATFLLFFLLRDGGVAWAWLVAALDDPRRARLTEAAQRSVDTLGASLRASAMVSLVAALTDLVVLLVLGVPFAGGLALMAFVLRFIPWLGPLIMAGVLVLVTLGERGLPAAIVVAGLLLLRGSILLRWWRPVMARMHPIHPAAALVALLAGYQLGGIVGLIAAVPMATAAIGLAPALVDIAARDPRADLPDLPELVPGWLDRLAQLAWRALVAIGLLAIVAWAATALPTVIVPIVIAVILAATLESLVPPLLARGWSRGAAAATVVTATVLGLVAIVGVAIGPLVDQGAMVATSVSDGARRIDAEAAGQLGLAVEAVEDAIAEVRRFLAIVGGIVGPLAMLGASALLTILLLRDGGRAWTAVVRRVPTADQATIGAAGRRAVDVLGGYMFGTAVISLVGAASQAFIMAVLGLPFVLPVFVLSFFLCFIPYIGGFISTGIAFLITVSVGSTTDVVVMGIWTVVFNLVTGNIVSPLVYGRTVHLHPAIVLLAIPAASAVAGIVGMFLVVPVLGVIATTWRTVLALMGGGAGLRHGSERNDP